MKIRLCETAADAREKLPETSGDRSGIGAQYVDAYLKPLNRKLDDGTVVKARRRGLKVTLTVGAKKGEGLMRRIDVSRDPVAMLAAALDEAGRAAGIGWSEEDGAIYLTL